MKKGRKWKKSRKFTLRRFRTRPRIHIRRIRRFPPVSRRPVGPVRSRNPFWYRSRNRYLGSGCSRNRRSKNRRSRNRLLYAPLGCSRNLLCCCSRILRSRIRFVPEKLFISLFIILYFIFKIIFCYLVYKIYNRSR